MTCPICHSHEPPVLRSRVSTAGWLVILLATGSICFMPAALLGFFMRDRFAECPDCGCRASP
jgi:hypothetical protein